MAAAAVAAAGLVNQETTQSRSCRTEPANHVLCLAGAPAQRPATV